MTVQLTIIGLGKIGASMGLALAGETERIKRRGHDRNPDMVRRAQKLGAVDAGFLNLHQAVDGADIVVLAIPVDQIRETMELIAEDLKDGAVVLDTSNVKAAATAWSQELFHGERYFVSFTPTINPEYLYDTEPGIEGAHNDLFQNGTIVITSPQGTDGAALKLATDLAAMIGGTTLFSDAVEADGLFASVNLLPQLASAALVNATVTQPGWQDARRFAGPQYVQMTEPVLHLDDIDRLGQSVLLNKDNAVRLLNDLIRALVDLRDSIAEGDEPGVQKLFEQARDGRLNWWVQRKTASWEKTTAAQDMPKSGDMFKGMFGMRGKKK
jgi:prephenate dehydrogenase